jgi:hypothetical protein
VVCTYVKEIWRYKREDDLVIATLPWVYVLDDFSPLRNFTKEPLKDAFIAPLKKAWMYMESLPFGFQRQRFWGKLLNTPNLNRIYIFY